MANTEDIAEFVQRRISLGRIYPGAAYWHLAPYYHGADLPPVKTVAAELLADTEFRALELGRLLNTPTGAFLEQAVALAVPSAYTPEFDLVVAALELAAKLQQGQARDKAILVGLGTAAVSALIHELRPAA